MVFRTFSGREEENIQQTVHKNLQELLDKNSDLIIIHCVDILRKGVYTMKKKLLAVVLAGAMAMSLGACGSSNSGSNGSSASTGSSSADSTSTSSASASETNNSGFAGTPDADMYTIDLRTEPAEMNSVLTTDVPSSDLLRMTMSGLYRLDKNDTPQPDLAESTEVSEDGCTYTMKLRQDAKWTNGEPVTANDFVFALQTICNKETASAYAFIVYDNVLNGSEVYDGTMDPSELGVKALDDYTLQITFKNPIPYAEHLMAFASYYPLNQKAYEEIGADKYGDEADQIVTNGAYKISEWVHNDHITLTANEDFYDPDRCAVKNLKFVMLNDTNARMNAFQGGQIDCINLSGDQVAQAEQLGITVENYIDNGNWYLQYNTQHSEVGLNNANIRLALGMAIDSQSLCDNILKDGSVPATGLVPTTISGANGEKYREAVGDFVGYDPDAAKAAFEKGLEETGLTAADIKPALLCDDSDAAQKIAQFFQAQWKEVLGIDVEITPQQFKSRLDSMDSGDFDIVYAGWAPDYNDAMTYLDMFMKDNGNNYGKYDNPQYDELLKQAQSEQDAAKRQDLMAQAEQLVTKTDAAIYPIYFSACSYAVSDKVQGMTRTGFQEFDFTDAAD